MEIFKLWQHVWWIVPAGFGIGMLVTALRSQSRSDGWKRAVPDNDVLILVLLSYIAAQLGAILEALN